MNAEENFLPCDECAYIAVKATGGCNPLLCVYGALNRIAKMLYEDEKVDSEIQSSPTFIVEAEPEESRDEKLGRVMELTKELHRIHEELDATKLEDFPHKEREIERIHDIREELDVLKRELGLLPE